MSSSGKDAYFKKPLEVSKKYPYHLKLEKSEFDKFTSCFKGDVQGATKVEIQLDNRKSVETEKGPESENKSVRLRGKRGNKKDNVKSKKYEVIPIVVHESEKPSLVLEEMNAGKIYPTQYKFENITKVKDKSKTNKKKYAEIPIIAHDSEKPSLIIEETNSGKIYPYTWATVNDLNKKNKNTDKYKSNKNKKYAEIPIIAHDSEKPSLATEELRSGKLFPNPWSIVNIKTGTKAKDKGKNLKAGNKKKYAEILIIAHDSQKPSLVFEETNSGKICHIDDLNLNLNCETKNNSANIKTKDKNKGNKAKTNKKYMEIPIVVHESEKPSLIMEEIRSGKIYPLTWCKIQEKVKKDEMPIVVHDSEGPSAVFEECGSGKLRSLIQTSVTNYKDTQKKNILKSGVKKNLKKYKEIPIISHESESPSFVFEENNAGHNYKKIQTSVTQYKEDKKAKLLNKKQEKKSEKKEKSKIIVHESEGPSLVFEQSNSGRFYSNKQTTTTDYSKLKKLRKTEKREKSPIVAHKSEKPSFVFEEANTGVLLDFNHQL